MMVWRNTDQYPAIRQTVKLSIQCAKTTPSCPLCCTLCPCNIGRGGVKHRLFSHKKEKHCGRVINRSDLFLGKL
uniref:Uncharacterized protein n=1 Tax=Anguilla anguilla TaxID=7936 RepID=A0A0E9UHC4_ANGAN